MLNLFQLFDVPVTLHSGGRSRLKINCDALTDDDWDGIAYALAHRLLPFGDVVGVPQGGLKLADAMRKYAKTGPLLIVDDVLTTGKSMNELYAKLAKENPPAHGIIGGVFISRGGCPWWVTPLLRMEPLYNE